jgi:hypothetical protein
VLYRGDSNRIIENKTQCKIESIVHSAAHIVQHTQALAATGPPAVCRRHAKLDFILAVCKVKHLRVVEG